VQQDPPPPYTEVSTPPCPYNYCEKTGAKIRNIALIVLGGTFAAIPSSYVIFNQKL